VALIIARATHPDPSKRFQTVASLKRAYFALIDIADSETELQELMSLRTALSAGEGFDDGQVERFLTLLGRHAQENDLLRDTIMTIDPGAIAALFDSSPETTRRLLDQFVLQMSSSSWGFSYTDEIATRCRDIYNAVSDPEIRAAMIECCIYVGAGHNRWFVMKVAGQLLQGAKTPQEIVALLHRLDGIRRPVLDHIRGYVRVSDLHRSLVPYFSD
jgi:eukaryotic-like serine/threonine-protein kinase